MKLRGILAECWETSWKMPPVTQRARCDASPTIMVEDDGPDIASAERAAGSKRGAGLGLEFRTCSSPYRWRLVLAGSVAPGTARD